MTEKQFYEDLYESITEEDQAESENQLRRVAWAIRKERTDEILTKVLKKINKPADVIDIGCGGMWPSSIIFRENPSSKYIGGDIALSYLKKGINSVNISKTLLTSSSLPFRKASADIVMALETLEHVLKLSTTFQQMVQISKRFIFISVPIIGSQILGLDKYHYNKLAKNIETTMRTEMSVSGINSVLRDLQQTTGAAHINVFTISNLKEMVNMVGRIIHEQYGLFMFPGISWLLSRKWGIILYRFVERKFFSRIPIFRISRFGNEYIFLVIERMPSKVSSYEKRYLNPKKGKFEAESN
jgi:hypothetical protein